MGTSTTEIYILKLKLNFLDSIRERANNGLDQLMKGENTICFIKAQRLRWLGHGTRIGTKRAQEKFVKAKSFKTKGRDRPRSISIDELEEDMEKFGIKDWRKIPSD